MTVEIRPATTEDVEEVRRVSERAWYEAHAPIIGEDATREFLDRYYDPETLRAVIDDRARILDVAVTGGDVVGFVSGGPDEESPETFHLNRVYVHPDRWGQGIGRRLVEHVETKVARRGQEQILLGVMAENERAIRFYESAGFDRQKEFYDDNVDATSYIYEKTLADG